MAGIYIHIPFCNSKCYYCDFFSRKPTNSKIIDDYVDALCKEFDLRKNYLQNEKIQTIYFGGGTPSILSISQLEKIFAKIGDIYDISKVSEITLEANPEDITKSKCADLKKFTIVNRLSIGVQSFFDDDLKFMNRRHSNLQSIQAIETALKAGFENLTIDLIYGLPNMTLEKWKENLSKLFSFDLPHFSAYHLMIEEGTVFNVWKNRGKIKEIDEQKSFEMFKMLIDEAQKNGYEHYEISNFAKPRMEAIHNSNYWAGEKYIGIGTSAHSYDKKSRQWNIANISKYIDSINKGIVPNEIEFLTEQDKFNDYIITSLRTSKGLEKQILETKFKTYFEKIKTTLFKYIHSGMILEKPDSFVLFVDGQFISDSIMIDLIIV